jgi:hypothetical protein
VKVIDKKESKMADGEIWFGIPTWDPADRNGLRSVKFAYKTSGGRWARTSPEVPEAVVWEMLLTLADHERLPKFLGRKNRPDIEALIKALKAVGKAHNP